MTWKILALLIFAGLFAAGLLVSISSMLALKISGAIVDAWRGLRRRLAL